jgi:transposase
MAKHSRPWNPLQSVLFPPSPRDWLSEDHPVYFLLDVVAELELEELEVEFRRKDPRGMQPYDPRMMTALLLYGYCVGIRSSRKLEQATYDSVAFRVLTGDQHPDHSTISEFRRRNLGVLQQLFVQVLRLCEKAGLVKLGHVALDGTKVRANASKHKAMSYEFMKKKAHHLEEEIRRLLEEAAKEDEREDALYGKGRRGDELPEELRRRQTRLKKIRRAMAELEAEAAATRARDLKRKAEKAREGAKSPNPKKGAVHRAKRLTGKAGLAAAKANRKARDAGMPLPDLCRQPDVPVHETPAEVSGDPTPQAQRSFTDPDSRIMLKGKEFVQAYNCQAAVDASAQVIVGQAVTNLPADCGLLPLMLDRIEGAAGALPAELSADAGYCSEANLETLADRIVDAYVATERVTDRHNLPTPIGRIPNNLSLIERMRRKLRTKKGKRAYALRKQVVECVFGQIKEAGGFRRFLLRGLEKVSGEWALVCTGHNLGKLLRALAAAKAVLAHLRALIVPPRRVCRIHDCAASYRLTGTYGSGDVIHRFWKTLRWLRSTSS